MLPYRTTSFLYDDPLIAEIEHKICEHALSVIRDKRHSFQHIEEKRPFGDDPLQKPAVTHNSFVLLCRAMNMLSNFHTFHSYAIKVVHLCEEQLDLYPDKRDGARVLEAIKELERRLVEHLQPSSEW